jgi:glycosyltransferase involved in cell wall biosynthesis
MVEESSGPRGLAEQPARVLFCESSSNFGGQESQILLQMEFLRAAGHHTLLVCRAGSRIAGRAAASGLPFRTTPFRNSLDPRSVWAVWRELLRGRFDAAIGHSGHDANVMALAARMTPRRPALLRVRTYLPGYPRAAPYAWLVDRTLVPSNFLRGELLQNPRIPPERVFVLRPMIPLEALRLEATHPLPMELDARIAGARPLIVHAAMLRSEKGHRMALGVVARLRERFPNLLYVIAGSGAREAGLRANARSLGIESHVVFAGLLQPVAPLLARADAVIMPSSREPLGLAQVEALALGVPVAVSDAGGLPETVHDRLTGRIFPATDPAAWVHGLTEILENPTEARAQAARGKSEVEREFAPDRHLASLLAHLRLRPHPPR